MPTNLILQTRQEVQNSLDFLVSYVIAKNYDLPLNNSLRGFFNFLGYFSYNSVKCYIEGAKPLREALQPTLNSQTTRAKSIADFCCGNGSETLKLAELFPNVQIYGLDILPPSIKSAKKRARGNPNIHFSNADVYTLDNSHSFDAVVFNRACGPLADKIIEYATDKDVPLIAGRFCCHYTLSDKQVHSKNVMLDIYMSLVHRLDNFVRKRVRNYVRSENQNSALLSEFAKQGLKLTDEELERIALTCGNSNIGLLIIDLNRIMKLIEKGYEVNYSAGKHIVVARK